MIWVSVINLLLIGVILATGVFLAGYIVGVKDKKKKK